jgi:hypothetical protein
MQTLSNLPVIVGAGLTGMAISDSLSRSEIQHVLIGAPPTDSHRLGESLDGVGSRTLMRTFPELQRFCYTKRYVIGLFGKYVMGVYLESPPKVHRLARMLGIEIENHLIHVDRTGFDCALFEQISASKYCNFMDVRVESLTYSAKSDLIEQLNLSTGESLVPKFVYDCTNHVRLVGKALNIPIQFTSAAQRVVFTRCNSNEKIASRAEWQHGTHLLLLGAEWDQIDGAAWAIPLGSVVSLGISLPFRDNPLDDAEVIELLKDAFARRGLDIRKFYPNPSKIVAIPRQQYFTHDRGHGANWMLAGTTYCQAWFPTSSGFGAALIAAHLAPGYLRNPAVVGPWYETYLRRINDSHALFDALFSNGQDNLSREGLQFLVDGLVTNNLERILRSEQLDLSRVKKTVMRLATEIVSRTKTGKNWGRILQVELNEQIAHTFAQKWRTW